MVMKLKRIAKTHKAVSDAPPFSWLLFGCSGGHADFGPDDWFGYAIRFIVLAGHGAPLRYAAEGNPVKHSHGTKFKFAVLGINSMAIGRFISVNGSPNTLVTKRS
jgi:hypothetical protein